MYVTSPILPDFDDFVDSLRQIWDSRWLTNNGPFLIRFEQALAEYLQVPYVSVMTNGTLPLLLSLKALEITEGEVITTPYTFVATAGVVKWSGLTPVFADVDPDYGTLDPDAVEAAITPRTRAILAVHVYGYPCSARLQEIAERHNLPLIFDAAHAFGVRRGDRSLLLEGDLSTLSLHATKVFNTIEGGAVVCKTAEMKKRLDRMRNFGITSDITLDGPGLNAKMDEIRAAYGLLNLRQLPAAIEARARLSEAYRDALSGIPGIRIPALPAGVDYNYSHFPIYIEDNYRLTRDEVYALLQTHDIYPRRYFYPVLTDFPEYREGERTPLPVAHRLAAQVLCLPLYPHLPAATPAQIAALLK